MTIHELNNLSDREAARAMEKSCGSSAWVKEMVESRPYTDLERLINAASHIWSSTKEPDWKEAFKHHPKIGDISSLAKKCSTSKSIAQGEQKLAENADQTLLQELKKLNELYEQKFGFIFIVFASGKSAREMLNLLNERINNSVDAELINAKNEQEKITINRLNKLFTMISISSHILNTSTGQPAQNVQAVLSFKEDGNWTEIGKNITDREGRISTWNNKNSELQPGKYKISFLTKGYFDLIRMDTFYPYIDIIFEIMDKEHYHVPLLINPFGYTTYRGS